MSSGRDGEPGRATSPYTASPCPDARDTSRSRRRLGGRLRLLARARPARAAPSWARKQRRSRTASATRPTLRRFRARPWRRFASPSPSCAKGRKHWDDDATLLLSARQVLGGPTDDGRASHQVAIDVYEDCRRARQTGDGELFRVSSATRAMAACDAQQLSSRPRRRSFNRFQRREPARSRRVRSRAGQRSCRPANAFVGPISRLVTRARRASGGRGMTRATLLVSCGRPER